MKDSWQLGQMVGGLFDENWIQVIQIFGKVLGVGTWRARPKKRSCRAAGCTGDFSSVSRGGKGSRAVTEMAT